MKLTLGRVQLRLMFVRIYRVRPRIFLQMLLDYQVVKTSLTSWFSPPPSCDVVHPIARGHVFLSLLRLLIRRDGV